MQRAGARVVLGAARQRRRCGDLFPRLRRKPCDQNVVGSRELSADLGDLLDRLSLRENDLGKTHAPQAIEVEGVVGGHGRDLMGGEGRAVRRRANRRQRQTTRRDGGAAMREYPLPAGEGQGEGRCSGAIGTLDDSRGPRRRRVCASSGARGPAPDSENPRRAPAFSTRRPAPTSSAQMKTRPRGRVFVAGTVTEP